MAANMYLETRGPGETLNRFISYVAKRKNSHAMLCEGMQFWREDILEERLRNIGPEIGIMRMSRLNIKNNGQEIEKYFIKYKDKLEWSVRTHGSGVEQM
jgi:hypothetical protein